MKWEICIFVSVYLRLMDCAALCLLTATVGFVPSPDTINCSYCVEARSTYSDCFDNVIECAYRDPSSLILCLNVYEKAESLMIQHSVRCLSYAEFYIPDEAIKEIGASGMCKFNLVQQCECSVCRSTTTILETTTASHHKKHKHHKHHYSRDQIHISQNESLSLRSTYNDNVLFTSVYFRSTYLLTCICMVLTFSLI